MLQLQIETRTKQKAAYAEGTFGNFNTHWVKYLQFCVDFGLVALPARTATLTWFAQFASRKLKAYGSLVNCISSVKRLHELMGCTTTGFDGIMLKITLQGLRRNSTHIEHLQFHQKC